MARRSVWVQTSTEFDLAAATSQMVDIGGILRSTLGILNLAGFTEVRMLGHVTYRPDLPQAALQFVAVGITRVTERAFAAGVASVPDPTGGGDDWQYITQRWYVAESRETSAGVFDTIGNDWSFDMRSGRKMQEDVTLIGVVQSEIASTVGLFTRSLWLYP